MRLALFQPDIPQNLGAAIRLGACLGVPVDIVEPCGFPLSDRAVRRAAMDYAAANGRTPPGAMSNNFSLAEMLDPIWDGCVAASDDAITLRAPGVLALAHNFLR